MACLNTISGKLLDTKDLSNEAEFFGGTPSDHLPVTATVQFDANHDAEQGRGDSANSLHEARHFADERPLSAHVSPMTSRLNIQKDVYMKINSLVSSLCVLIGYGCVYSKEEISAHPDTSGWKSLFSTDLSNANYTEGVWTISNGELTASKDQTIWTKLDYNNFILDLEFKVGLNANSGVIIYCNDTKNWIPNSIEIQILDDDGEKWTDVSDNWRCGAIFGHLAPSKRMGKKPGEWNHYTITCNDAQIDVVLNGEHIISMDMNNWTNSKINPDGSKIPVWLSKPVANLPTKGKIGLQGKHGGAPIWFRNIKIKASN